MQRLLANRNYMTTLSANVLTLGLAMLTSIILARWMGPTGRGEVAAALLWPSLLIYLGSLGMIEAMLYFAAQPDARTDQLFASSLLFTAVQSAPIIALGYLLMPIFLKSQADSVVQLSRLYLLVIPVSLVSQYNISILRGKMKILAFNYIQSLIPIGYFVGATAFFFLKILTPRNVVALQFALNGFVLVNSFALLFAFRIPLGLRPNLALLKKMLRYGLVAHIGTIFSSANLRLDQVLMSAWVSSEQLGLYVTAVSAANLTSVLAKAIHMVATPNIAGIENPAHKITRLQSIFERYWVLSLVLKIAFAFVLPLAIPLIYGSAYRGIIVTAEVLLLASLFLDAKLVLTGGAQALGVPWLASRAELAASVVTVVMLVVLLPWLGILGAAITSAVAYAVGMLLILRGLRQEKGVSIRWLSMLEFVKALRDPTSKIPT